ncbi:hypothetical protein BA898_06065 [Spiribacter roseus]|nr:hypothetical protein BA898_06065 [Spiribacter roseus]
MWLIDKQYLRTPFFVSRQNTGFCVEALDAALGQSQPLIFNTDQGAQFTAPSGSSDSRHGTS